MIPLTLQQLAGLAGAEMATPERGGEVLSAVATDSRRLAGGELFIALTGEHHDAHRFLPQAVAAGAAALMVEPRARDQALATGAAVLTVPDTLTGLQALARGLRREINPLVVAVTGSNGKTSTKEFLRAVLGARHRVAATPGNFNNHVGLPLTLLGLEHGHEVMVCELGMNHPGEIAPLAAIAEPDIAVITNIGVAHIEFMGSREAIAREKGELVAALSSDGLAVLNADDPFTDSIAARCRGRVVRAGIDAGDVQAREPVAIADGMAFTLSAGGESVPASIPVAGRHMVANAALAAAVGWCRGLALKDIASALAGTRPSDGRLQLREAGGLRFLDDSYNANPDSMRAGILTLIESARAAGGGRTLAVLGHMAELGPEAGEIHRDLGGWIAGQGIDALCVVGRDAAALAEGAQAARAGDWVAWVEDHPAAAAFVQRHAGPDDLVLLKGSRTARMEAVLECLSDQP